MRLLRRFNVDRDPAGVMNLFHGAGECGHDRPDVGDGADHSEPGSKPRALEVTGHLVVHDAGLLAHLGGERVVAAPGRLVDHHGEWRLERVREVAHMGAGALDDLAVRLDQRVGVQPHYRRAVINRIEVVRLRGDVSGGLAPRGPYRHPVCLRN